MPQRLQQLRKAFRQLRCEVSKGRARTEGEMASALEDRYKPNTTTDSTPDTSKVDSASLRARRRVNERASNHESDSPVNNVGASERQRDFRLGIIEDLRSSVIIASSAIARHDSRLGTRFSAQTTE